MGFSKLTSDVRSAFESCLSAIGHVQSYSTGYDDGLAGKSESPPLLQLNAVLKAGTNMAYDHIFQKTDHHALQTAWNEEYTNGYRAGKAELEKRQRTSR
jgi:hypothetical protein